MYIVVMIGFVVFFVTMAIGVIFGRQPIAGSCGGLAQVGLNGECKVCGKTPGSCDPAQLEARPNQRASHTINAAPQPAQKTLAQRLDKPRFRDPLDF